MITTWGKYELVDSDSADDGPFKFFFLKGDIALTAQSVHCKIP